MGTTCDVIIVGGGDSLASQARERVDDLERRWSRFLADSELSRLNRAGGRWQSVSDDTLVLIDRMLAAWRWTEGRFDPTVLSALERAGYDRNFPDLVDGAPPPVGAPTPGCGAITVDRQLRVVWLPVGVRIDPGGIGKGLAADIVVEELLDKGAAGACVSLGGDLRVAGEPPDADSWRSAIADPYDAGRLLATVRLHDSAIATSTRLLRAWTRAGVAQHHLIDPKTGTPTNNGIDAISVIAGEAWWAEVQTKAGFVAGEDAAQVLAGLGGAGLIFRTDGSAEWFGPFEDFLVAGGVLGPDGSAALGGVGRH